MLPTPLGEESEANQLLGQSTPVRHQIRQHGDATPPGGPATLAVKDMKSGRTRETESESERERERVCVRAREPIKGEDAQSGRGAAGEREGLLRACVRLPALAPPTGVRAVYTRRNGFPSSFSPTTRISYCIYLQNSGKNRTNGMYLL